ncbi:MAG: hypothetical protein ACLTBF_03200 [Christensenellales bacterium]
MIDAVIQAGGNLTMMEETAKKKRHRNSDGCGVGAAEQVFGGA